MISLIAAISQNNCIGVDNDLPWHIPEDLKHFKKVTSGKTVLMGRKTWESLPDKFRPLPNRTNIVVTRRADYPVPEGVLLYTSLDEALSSHANDDVFVIGGAQIYTQTIDTADRLYITHVDTHVDGHAFFPQIDEHAWIEAGRDPRDGFTFVRYERN